jgi:hypothetical protein
MKATDQLKEEHEGIMCMLRILGEVSRHFISTGIFPMNAYHRKLKRNYLRVSRKLKNPELVRENMKNFMPCFTSLVLFT